MVERDVVVAKIDTIDRCLRRIDEVRRRDRGLEPQDVQDILELNLQRAVQATLDLASHVVATEAYGTPDKLADTFTLIERQGLIPPDLAEHLRKMVGFRNLVVHDYGTVDPDIVESIIEHRLGDLEAFARAVLDRFGLEPGRGV